MCALPSPSLSPDLSLANFCNGKKKASRRALLTAFLLTTTMMTFSVVSSSHGQEANPSNTPNLEEQASALEESGATSAQEAEDGPNSDTEGAEAQASPRLETPQAENTAPEAGKAGEQQQPPADKTVACRALESQFRLLETEAHAQRISLGEDTTDRQRLSADRQANIMAVHDRLGCNPMPLARILHEGAMATAQVMQKRRDILEGAMPEALPQNATSSPTDANAALGDRRLPRPILAYKPGTPVTSPPAAAPKPAEPIRIDPAPLPQIAEAPIPAQTKPSPQPASPPTAKNDEKEKTDPQKAATAVAAPATKTPVKPEPPQAQSTPKVTKDTPKEPPKKTSSLPDPKMVPMNGRNEMRMVKSAANVRLGPSTDYPKMGTVRAKTMVRVTAKVKGKNWYQIALPDGQSAFIFGRLLAAKGETPKRAAPKLSNKEQEALFGEIQRKAKAGDPEAQYSLGNYYIQRGDSQAITWWKRAAEQDHPAALYNLGVAHWRGEAAKQDRVMAIEYLRLSAQQGHQGAQRMIAQITGDTGAMTPPSGPPPIPAPVTPVKP